MKLPSNDTRTREEPLISAKEEDIEELLEWAREQGLKGHPDRLLIVGEEIYKRYAGLYRWLGRRELLLEVLDRLEET